MYQHLISAAEYLSLPQTSKVLTIDCRHQLTDANYGNSAFAAGHLPGAIFLHLDHDLSGTKTGTNGRHPLPDADRLAEKLRAIGLSNQTQVIAYDDAGGMFAARLWWLLRWLGHEAVAVLDGGVAAYLAAGGQLTTEMATYGQGDFSPRPSLEATVSAADLVSALGSGAYQIVDARAPGRYAGEGETLDPVGGHIPGARNYFFQTNLDSNGLFLSPEQLRTQWHSVVGDVAFSMVVNQCGSGVTACHNRLAQFYAGLDGAKLYPGSWSEWCADPDRPVATGSTP